MLEARFPRIPGDMGNAGTWPFPVLYKVVSGASPQRVVRERAAGLLDAFTADRVAPSARDAGQQLTALVHPGFVSETGVSAMEHIARYVSGIEIRLSKLREKPERDRELMTRVNRLEERYAEVLARPEAASARWLLQELRVSLFAQQLGTVGSVSEHRVVAELSRVSAPT